jgi:tetratricopeptide (TPR) repeat protein
MARRRKPKGPSRATGSVPSAAELLGKLVTRLRVPSAADTEPLRSKNAERFLAGETKPPDVAATVLEALATVLARHGYLPTAGWPGAIGFPTPAFLVERGLRNLRTRWDQAVGDLRAGALRDETNRFVTITAAHLLTIDLATRAGAWIVLLRHPFIESEDPPILPTIAGVAEEVLAESGLSAPQLAAEVGVERTTVDRWRAGARPLDETLGFVAEFLATKRPGTTPESIHSELRARLAIAELLRDLRAHPAIANEAEDLWVAFWFLARGVARRIAELPLGTIHRVLTSLVMWGVSHPVAIPVLEDLGPRAPAPWRADLQAGPAWAGRLLYAVQTGFGVAATIAAKDLPEWANPDLLAAVGRHVLSVPTTDVHPIPEGFQVLRIKNPPDVAAENRRVQASAARSRLHHEEAIDHLRRAVELVPTHAEAHFELGANLWMAGYFDEAIRECEIAAALKPEWELPRVEVGIVLLNADKPEEARAYLEQLHVEWKEPSTHLKYNLATARWDCGDFAGADELFEQVLADETYQSYAHALSQAAHCKFKLGDHVKGLELAKQARDLGVGEAYRLWSIGAYRARQ